MNIEEKTKLAHEWFMEMVSAKAPATVATAWKYADAMEVEYNKRLKEQEDKTYDPMRNVRTKQVPPTVEAPPIKIIGGG